MLRNAPFFVIAIVAIAAINLAFRVWRGWKTRKTDARGIRLGLKTEIGQLLLLLDENARTLAEDGADKRLAVMRGADIYFRSVANRLSVLDAEVEAIVRAYSSIECTDRIVAMACRPTGPMAFSLKDESKVPVLKDSLALLRKHLLDAVVAIDAAAEASLT